MSVLGRFFDGRASSWPKKTHAALMDNVYNVTSKSLSTTNALLILANPIYGMSVADA